MECNNAKRQDMWYYMKWNSICIEPESVKLTSLLRAEKVEHPFLAPRSKQGFMSYELVLFIANMTPAARREVGVKYFWEFL